MRADPPSLSVDFHCQYAGGPSLTMGFHTAARATALFGPSGAGKTTILNAIAGLLRPSSGRISFADQVLFDAASSVSVPIHRRRIGYVFQDHLLFPHLDVAANLRFGMPTRRAGENRISIARVVATFELGDLLARRPSELSGGQRQRVALGRAILSSPRLLLLDEPFAGLDQELRGRTLDFLDRLLNDFDAPIVFVSHNQAEVRRLAERVVLVKDGRVAAEGSAEEVLSRGAALELPAPMGLTNLLKLDRIETRDGGVSGWIGSVEISLPGPPNGRPTRFISVDPAAVTLATADVHGVSARNHLPGEIAAVVESGERVFVAVDIGAPLWAEVTHSAAAELGLVVGRPVVCLFKTQSIHFI